LEEFIQGARGSHEKSKSVSIEQHVGYLGSVAKAATSILDEGLER
jgi:hypothetical protein